MEKSIAEIHERVYAHLIMDETLRFTLRQKNREGRINQGFWFSGNDNYLAFSFWKGVDWRNKTPNIYFQINLNGTCSLDFVSYDDDKKVTFFNNLRAFYFKRQIKIRRF